ASPGVADKDEVACVGPVLHFMEEHRAVNCLGSAVDIQDGRVFLPLNIIHGPEHPAVNGYSRGSLEGEVLRPGELALPWHPGIEACKLALRARFQGVELLEAQLPQADQENAFPLDAEAVHGA